MRSKTTKRRIKKQKQSKYQVKGFQKGIGRKQRAKGKGGVEREIGGGSPNLKVFRRLIIFKDQKSYIGNASLI